MAIRANIIRIQPSIGLNQYPTTTAANLMSHLLLLLILILTLSLTPIQTPTTRTRKRMA